MKIYCIAKNLKEALIVAERNTAKNQTLPILGSILLETQENNKIKIKATNLETAIEITIPAKVEKQGVVAVPAKNLSSFVSNISSEEGITIQNQNDNVYVKTSKTQTVIKGYKNEDFPLFPKVSETVSINFNGESLKEALSSVVIACSMSDIKPELSSVLLRIFKNTIKFTATDSFRLAEKTITSKNNYLDKSFSILLPQKSIMEILKIINSGDVICGFNKNQLILTSGNIKFITRLIDGVFPEYDQIIPKEFKTSVLASNSDFVYSLKLSSVFVGRLNDVSLKFDPQKKTSSFYTSNADIGEHNSEIECEVKGDEVKAKYNWRYLFDGISQIKSEHITLGLNGDQAPLVVRGKGDGSFLYLVMPLRGV